jgi:hypothetical protein
LRDPKAQVDVAGVIAKPSRAAFARLARRLNYLAIDDRLAQLVGTPKAGANAAEASYGRKHIQQPWRPRSDRPWPSYLHLKGTKLYDLKGVNIYKLSGELVGHLTDAQSTKRHLDKSTDKLFPAS